MRLLYKHVAILNRGGIGSAILHYRSGFRLQDMPEVPISYLMADPLRPGDVVVIPEGGVAAMKMLAGRRLRLIVVALNWSYIYSAFDGYSDWREFGIERVLVNSPFINDFVSWAMRLPTHQFISGIDPKLYFEPTQKAPQVSFIERKQTHCDVLKRILYSRNPDFVSKVAWKGHVDLPEHLYASEIRKSAIFLNLSSSEGLPFSMLEAMRTGALVVGYNGVGGKRELVGDGLLQNCVLSDNGDYVGLARNMDAVLTDLLRNDRTRWDPVIKNGIQLSKRYTLEQEESTVLKMWNTILGA
jgi:hypothetical protein